ncbi:MAG: hypothetical protein LBJ15_08085 [Comamonas sp.]|uniref:hypothetical protein n=1 Tax=Comamonas sp. TaxID=34028 RepID=UPI002837FF62|nr:hypothetical protein [Comamonas sp.]MDR0213949.1 hypothetical protein [Comamonas sp.]
MTVVILQRKWLRLRGAVISESDAQAAACSCAKKQDWFERHSFSLTESEGLMKENDPGPMKRLHAFAPQQAPQGLRTLNTIGLTRCKRCTVEERLRACRHARPPMTHTPERVDGLP